MALTERVLLFHDRAPHGPAHAEFLDAGLGWLPGCVLLPHARRRLRTDDPARMAELAVPGRAGALRGARRRRPARPRPTAARCPPDARVVAADGRIRESRAS